MIKAELMGKTAAVTAAGKEPGRSIALALANCGAKVICLDEDITLAKETASFIENSSAYELDVKKQGELYAIVDGIVAKEGKIDILVNNEKDTFSPEERKPVHEMDMSRYYDVTDRELIGLYFTTKAFLQGMVANKSGVVINITSILGLAPKKGMVANCACAAATMSLSRVWALELDNKNVRVHCIARGAIEGELPEDAEELRHQTVKRTLTAADVADSVVFLASDEAQMENGCILTVDGSLHYGYMRSF